MGTYDTELEQYKGRLRRQSDAISRILDINSYGVIPPESSAELRSIQDRAQELLRKLETGEYEIAIVGLEKAGKSTFANALMGCDILPTQEARCTYTATSIRYSDEDCADIYFATREEFNDSFRKNLLLMNIPHAEALSVETLSLSDYERAFNDLDPQTRKYYESNVNQDILEILKHKDTILGYLDRPRITFRGSEVLRSQDFQQFIVKPEYAIAVKKIVLYSHELGAEMQNAVIYDVPGFDSPTEMHKAQTKELMKRSDAILFVTSADKPSLTAPSVDIFRTQSDDDGIRLGDKMFVFANRADMAGQLEQNLETMRGDLSKHNVMASASLSRIVPGSAKARLQARGCIAGNDALNAVKDKALPCGDGIDTIYQMLKEYNQGERFSVLKRRVNNLQNTIEQTIRGLVGEEEAVSFSLGTDREKMALQLMSSASAAIEKALQDYRSELQVRYSHENHPLTDALRDSVDTINVENFRVTDEEMDRAVKSTDTPTQNTQPVDMRLREWKRSEIYRKFQECVFAVAGDAHRECDEYIEKAFLDSLGVSTTNMHYDELARRVHEFINRQKNGILPEGYYDSLVHRFSEGVFYLLLHYPFGYGSADRWHYFDSYRSSFYSLAMYDDAADPTRLPEQQPLLYQLLYHDSNLRSLSSAAAKAREFVFGAVAEGIRSFALGSSVNRLVYTLGAKPAMERLEKLFGTNGKAKTLESALCLLDNELDLAGDEKPGSSTEEDSYNQWANSMPPKDYSLVRQYIDDDIDVLHQVLQSTIVRAICIETPFLALEVGLIRTILEKTKQGSDEFIEFISTNIPLIKADEYHSMDEEQQRRQARLSIQKEIRTILDGMNRESA